MRRSAGNVTLNTIKNFMFYILTYLKSRNYNTNVWLRTYIDYTDYADILTTLRWLHWYTDYTDCADILTTLTTLIYWLRWYIDYTDYADILTTLTTLIYWLHWLRWYIDYTEYTDILTTLTALIYWLRWLRWYSTLHEKQFHHRLHWLRCYERLLLIKHSSMATLIFKSNSHHWLRWLPSSTYNN